MAHGKGQGTPATLEAKNGALEFLELLETSLAWGPSKGTMVSHPETRVYSRHVQLIYTTGRERELDPIVAQVKADIQPIARGEGGVSSGRSYC